MLNGILKVGGMDMNKNLILFVLATLFVIFSPNASSHGCADHGPKENVECVKDSDGNCVEN